MRGEVKERGGGHVRYIGDDEEHRDRPQPPSARRVAAGRHRFLCRELDAVALATNVTVFMKRGTQGQGRLRLQDEESTVSPGVLCHIPANTPHDFLAEGDEPLLMFYVTVKVKSEAD